ncbi:hypothetical protein AOL_s00007g480 [Orbilia oligospora ATCC 24927]|uniref:Uncharacterized protein n=1 Tax=Arthrobotrys oligospora (strain ATCC 24927 / CBS 115.81 / DSM 1491) TaxID=756982 RepID=G1X2H1_ARTOA|nr:hypothetical protein AOL_s00007g480 [Orbilia oligospora ATCC 24927]EGX52697.1 hypothetical protein AOL_s00007g480 [Orbilia oligospora ATCC 24927]
MVRLSRLPRRIRDTSATKVCRDNINLKDSKEFEEADEYCPHCDNHYVLEAKTPRAALRVESEDVRMDSRFIKDDRLKDFDDSELFDVAETADRLG